MRAITLLFIVLAIIAAASCADISFTATGTVQVGTNAAWAATIKANTATNKVQIEYTFGIKEVEIYDQQSRYQLCPSDCKNYFLINPMPDFEIATTGSYTLDSGYRKYVASSNNGYQTIVWTVNVNNGNIVKVQQTGPNSFKRIYQFTAFTYNTNPAFTTPPTECTAVQCGQALDLMLVIDSSGSISSNDYIVEMNYAQQVIDSFTISEFGVHAGLVTFATDSLLRQSITDDKTLLTAAIDNAQQQGGETNIGDAILQATQQLTGVNSRSNVPKVMILLTDGKANRPDPTPISYMITKANNAKSAGILIYAIGVGSLVQQTDLNDVASAPTSQFTSLVGNFAELQTTINSILQQVCVGGEVDGCETNCYSDTQFCGCGNCMCVGSQASCGTRGTFVGGSTCACECTGFWEQTTGGSQTHSCVSCSLTGCQNQGTVNSDCQCTCPDNFSGDYCERCDFVCPTGATVADSCDACQCAPGTFYTPESNCRTCPSAATLCNGNGSVRSGCTGCDCDILHNGDFCQYCNWVCTHGDQNEDCRSCSCHDDWNGDHCDNCIITCINGGTRNSADGGCKCDCLARWSGTNCQECSSTYCKHGRMGSAPDCQCTCAPDWTGVDCGTCNIQCVGGTRQDDCTCKCAPGYKGTYCDECITGYCAHGTQGNVAARSCGRCDCLPNWSDVKCDHCDLDDKDNSEPYCHAGTANGDCTACICNTSPGGTVLTEGQYCDVCRSDLCVHGSITPGSYPDCRCTCPSNFKGRTCRDCADNLCSNNGRPTDTNCLSCICDSTKNWSGQYCSECILECVHGTLDTDTCTCKCDDYWHGKTCADCHTENPEECFECSYNGVLSVDCTRCICDDIHEGAKCQNCKYSCGPHGERSEDCLTCECHDGWIGDLCDVCDTSAAAPYCNGRGVITNSDTDCNICECENQWEADDCSYCPIDCNGHGTYNEDCTACDCVNSWREADDCFTCDYSCNDNGNYNSQCRGCNCDDGWTGDHCDICDPNGTHLNRCIYDTGVLTDDCACDCLDQWTGEYCAQCDLSTLNCMHGDIIDYDINGVPQCRCRCLDNWVGDDCNYCGFLLEDNSLYQCPDDISQPVLSDCSCHCPDYYRDLEGCNECIITNEDCVHVKPDTVPDRTRGVCACICDGNWSGRNCSICDPEIVICEVGYRLNTETCKCDAICGDGLIVPEEECEISIMEEKDTVCCTNCLFDERRICDDTRTCTRYDFCEVEGSEIYCKGTDKMDYTIDADRQSIPLGPLTSNYWSKWGISVQTNVPVSIVDTNTIGYPSTNPKGGDISLGRAIVSTSAQQTGNLCFIMNEPTEVKSVSILGNSREPGVSNSLHILFYCANTIDPIDVDARNYGAGSVEFIGNPCRDDLVYKICYINFPSAAIGPVFFCDDNNHNLGRLGDYVWYDISVDNIQDSNELPVPNVPCKLYDGSTGRFLAITYTNDQGLYIFEYLYNGNYSVEFNVPVSYTFSTPVRYPYANVFHYGNLDNNFITDTVKEILIVDVGIYLFGAIGDYIYYDVSEDGIQNEPASYGIQGVTLNLYEASAPSTIIGTRVTDSFGYYLFAPLPVYKTATTFHSYIVEMIPPPSSIVTLQFSGTDRSVDCNFDRTTHFSDVIDLTLQKTIDLTIDGGIYYCCGSVGDRVWYDDKVTDGIQGTDEQGVPNVRVTLYHNDVAIGSQLTNATGYYLFTELQLSGTYYVHFDRVTGWVLTQKAKGTDREKDSDANPNGDTDVFYLTRERPHRRDIDAGIKRGCVTASECTSDDFCVTATCNANQCQYTNSVTCAPLVDDPCNEPQCQPKTGNCIAVPKITTEIIQCNDRNECTEGDVCVGGVCKGTPSNSVLHTCTDNNLCTSDDHCVEGVCAGTPCTENPDPCFTTVCDATGCKDVPLPNAPCDDGNYCTENDVCSPTGRCGGTPKVCANNEYCKRYSCDSRNGQCSIVEDTPNEPCSDGSPCTENDTCDARGRCRGTPKVCTGTNPCLNYFCENGECKTSVKSTTTPCNDNNSCTENDKCQPDASCAGTPKNCDDNKQCTTDTCEAGTCVHRILTDATCTDNNSCTDDVCDLATGTCRITPKDCDDGKPCTIDTCENGVCVYTPTSRSCSDNNLCTVFDACDPSGNCKGVPKDCDDKNDCTEDSCNAVTGLCEHEDIPNKPCNDATECTRTSYCTDGACVGYDVKPCTTSNPCTVSSCDPLTGSCIEESVVDNTVCQTNDLCKLNGVCISGNCQGRETACDDNNPCTVDSCLAGVCVFTHTRATNDIPCSDGNKCTIQDVCVFDAGFGISRCRGTEMDCDDDNICTNEYCNILTGECTTEYTDSTVACDDGIACTIHDVCIEGECHGTEKVCTPSDICRSNVCDESTGQCSETITKDEPCNDGRICTTNDKCTEQGTCRGTPKCDDLVHPNPCKDYQCSDTGDCIIINLDDNTPCNDNNPCTQLDVCILGQCTGRNPFLCENDVCNRRECVNNNGVAQCRTTFTQATCGESTECHDLICSQGTCTTVTSKDCEEDNTNPCTRRSCGADGTCKEENISGPCEDGDACTSDECRDGQCVSTPIVPCGDTQCTATVPCPTAPNCFHYECVNNQCILSSNTCTPSDNECVRIECNEATGQCEPHKLENTRCNDENSCTSNDICVSTGAGALDIECRGADIPCATRRCQVGVCNRSTGVCSYTITANATCNDGIDCTENDVCDAQGNCRGTQIPCDDGNTCTNDRCVSGACVHEHNTNTCSDGNLCTSNDRCVEGECIGGAPTSCVNTEELCKRTVCHPINGCVDVTVNDGTVCGDNTDSCFDGDFVCRGGVCIPPERVTCPAPVDPQCPSICVDDECKVVDQFCSDNNACTLQDRCRENGECIGNQLDCSYLDNGCVEGVCVNGGCVERPVTGARDCDDGDLCTNNVCENGRCKATPVTCTQSNNPCEITTCDRDRGCIVSNNPVTCTPAGVYNRCFDHICIDRVCTEVPPSNPCDDRNPCTEDQCAPETGECVHRNNDRLNCNDNDPCTNDVCIAGKCSSSPIPCDDGNVCTTDTCIGGVCVRTDNSNTCELSRGCITTGVCSNRLCVANAFRDCPRDNLDECQDVTCDRTTGDCIVTPVTDGITSCNDGNPCTVGDVCGANGCKGTTKVCETSTVECQESYCDAGECKLRANDNLQCHSADTTCGTSKCFEGRCITDVDRERDCSDDDLCTFNNKCTDDGCAATEYSCLLSPCIYSSCNDDGFCRFDEPVRSWNPLTYLGFRTQETASGIIRYYVIALNSLDGNVRGVVRSPTPVYSLAVKPYEGGLFALLNNVTFPLYKIPLNTSALNVLADGEFSKWNYQTTITTVQQPDLTFKPTFVARNQPHTYSLNARAKNTGKIYSISNSIPAVATVNNALTTSGWQGATWDNHGRVIYGIQNGVMKLLNVFTGDIYDICSDLVIPDVSSTTFIDMVTRYDESIVGALQNTTHITIFSVRFDSDPSGNPVCQTSVSSIAKSRFVNPTGVETFISITAVAFDDTVCTVAVGVPGSTGGNVTNHSGGGSPNNGGGPPPVPGTPPAPDTIVHHQGGSNPGSHTAGTTDNGVLTGGTGSIATAVVSVVGTSAVAAFAIFAVVLGLNNTKKDPPQNLTAALVSTETSAIASDNPLFQGMNEAATNVLV